MFLLLTDLQSFDTHNWNVATSLLYIPTYSLSEFAAHDILLWTDRSDTKRSSPKTVNCSINYLSSLQNLCSTKHEDKGNDIMARRKRTHPNTIVLPSFHGEVFDFQRFEPYDPHSVIKNSCS